MKNTYPIPATELIMYRMCRRRAAINHLIHDDMPTINIIADWLIFCPNYRDEMHRFPIAAKLLYQNS